MTHLRAVGIVVSLSTCVKAGAAGGVQCARSSTRRAGEAAAAARQNSSWLQHRVPVPFTSSILLKIPICI